ncbi:MAG: tetratricopeptide repeat protein [Planctomycetaceae bacterium]|nr:tetratricopeptide repeat protein [Planctomycetaceae bacterium]
MDVECRRVRGCGSWLGAFILAGALFSAAPGNQLQAQDTLSAKELLNQAYTLSQRAETEEQFTDVVNKCQSSLKLNPNEASRKYANDLISWSLNRRGELRAETERDEDALKDFETAVLTNPSNWRAIHNRGVSYAVAGKNAEALADFNQALQLEKNYPAVYFNRGELFSTQGKWGEAIADYSAAIKLNDKDMRSYTNRGYAYYQQRNYSQALNDFGKALQIDATWAPALVHRGALHGDNARWEQAANDYRQAIQVSPEFGLAYQQIAWLLSTCPDAKFRDAKLALDSAKRAIELDGDTDFHYLDTLAAAYAANGDFTNAVEAIKKALAGIPMGFDVFKADLESRLKLYEKREAYVEKPPVPKKAESEKKGEAEKNAEKE